MSDVPFTNIFEWLTMTFDELIEWGTRNSEPHHMVGIKISIPDVENTRSIGMDFRPISSLSGEMLADLLYITMQSNDEFSATSRIEIAMTIVRVPRGGALVKLAKLNKTNVLHVKARCILTPKGQYNDSKCLPRSLVLGKALADDVTAAEMKLLTRCRSVLLKRRTDALIKKAGVAELGSGGYVLNDVYKFSKALKNYEIIIYDSFTDPDSIPFKTLNKNKQIALFYMADASHFITVKMVKSFFGYPYQCEHCDKFLMALNRHRCKEICSHCRQIGPCKSVETLTC